MTNMWESFREEERWSPRFSRSFSDWEIEEVQNFLVIQEKRIIPNQEDVLLLKNVKRWLLFGETFLQVLVLPQISLFPSRCVWNPWVPSKVRFFAWKASWGKVLTLDQLKMRGRTLANRCFLCGEEEETVDHLLIHCSKARILWNLLLTIFCVSWVFPLSMKETLLSWQGSFVGKRRKKAWMATPLCILWTVWLERNKIVFDSVNMSINRMKTSFLSNL